MSEASLHIVHRRSLQPGATTASLETLARTTSVPEADLLETGDGWLTRLTRLAAAPFALDLYTAGSSGPGWRADDRVG